MTKILQASRQVGRRNVVSMKAGVGAESNEVSGAERRVSQLAAQFAEFRAANTSRKQIPENLRAAVVSALDEGVTASQIRYACKVKASQIDAWRQSTAAADQPSVPARTDSSDRVKSARILPVVESRTGALSARSGEPRSGVDTPEEVPVTLCIGSWSITLQRLPSRQAQWSKQ
jgi:hypothetical protein